MNLDDALAATARSGPGPRSNLAKLLAAADDDTTKRITRALQSRDVDKAHWSRALTKLGQSNGWISGGVTEESIAKFHAEHVTLP